MVRTLRRVLRLRASVFACLCVCSPALAAKDNAFAPAGASDWGVYLSGEAVFLKPFQAEGETPGFGTEAGVRVVGGLNGKDGLGVRFRWFEWNGSNAGNAGAFIERINVETFDAEVTKRFHFANVAATASAGYRYADYREFGLTDADQMRHGHGLTLSLELSHMLTDYFAVFGKARGSLQAARRGLDNGTPVTHQFFTTAEFQLGAEANLWMFDNGGRVFLRGAVEAQAWSGGVIGDGDSEDVGLFGGTVQAGVDVPLGAQGVARGLTTAGHNTSSGPSSQGGAGAFIAGEAVILRPYQSEGEAPGFDAEAAPRVIAGLVNDDGLGIRFRWFDWSAFNPNNVAQPPFIERISLETIDVELTQSFARGNLSGVASAGYRYADYREFGFFDADDMRNSNGLVVGLELAHRFTDDILLFGKGRYSLQYASKGTETGTPRSNLFFTTAELQLGAEATLWRFDGGGRVFVRGAAEAQSWSGGTIGDGDQEDLGLFGGTVLAGFHVPLAQGESEAAASAGLLAADEESEVRAFIEGEAVVVRPFHSEGETPGFEFEPAARVVAGLESADGLGARVRWFQWDQAERNNLGAGAVIASLDVETLDVELTKKINLGSVTAVASGGYRYADYREFSNGTPDQMRNSNGLVVGLELTHMFNDYISIFGKGRASMQFASKGLDNGAPVTELFFTTTEVQVGAEATLWKFGDGGRVYVRGAGEAQGWSGGVIGDGDSEDLALFGGSFRAGIHFPL